MAFRFRLQRVLDLRQKAEEEAARALAGAQAAEEAARAELAALEAQRDQLAQRGDAAAGIPVGTLRTVGFLLGRMDERLDLAARQTVDAMHAVAQRQQALQAAFRERRTLDRLKERHQDEWTQAAAAADRQTMDDIALARFGQQPDGPDGARATE